MIKRMLIVSCILVFLAMLLACGGGGGSSSGAGGGNTNPLVNAYISGKVMAADGTGITGARVEMQENGSLFWSDTTDSGGNFTDGGRLLINRPITGTIIAAKAGFSPNALLFSISPGEKHSPVEIVLGTGGTGGTEIGRVRISGTVKLSDGKSAEGVPVTVDKTMDDGYPAGVFATFTDANGNFSDDGTLIIGKVTTVGVHVNKDGYDMFEWNIAASPGGTYDLGTITLAVSPPVVPVVNNVRVYGIIKTASGEGVPFAQIKTIGSAGFSASTDANGNFDVSFSASATETISFYATKSGYGTYTQTITISPGGEYLINGTI